MSLTATTRLLTIRSEGQAREALGRCFPQDKDGGGGVTPGSTRQRQGDECGPFAADTGQGPSRGCVRYQLPRCAIRAVPAQDQRVKNDNVECNHDESLERIVVVTGESEFPGDVDAHDRDRNPARRARRSQHE